MIFIGNCGTGHTKGHMKTPRSRAIAKSLESEFKDQIQTEWVDEFRTSKLCSFCFKEIQLDRKNKFRLGFCKNCKPLNESEHAHFVALRKRKFE